VLSGGRVDVKLYESFQITFQTACLHCVTCFGYFLLISLLPLWSFLRYAAICLTVNGGSTIAIVLYSSDHIHNNQFTFDV